MVIASLVLGGWLNRQRATPPDVLPEEITPSSNDSAELDSLREQLKARDHELAELREQVNAQPDNTAELDSLREQLTDAREEAELTLLQLHQVQEELEHYFLESRDLQQKLDAVKTITPEQLEQLQRIRTRLLRLFTSAPTQPTAESRLKALVQRQQNALRRFQRLHTPAAYR